MPPLPPTAPGEAWKQQELPLTHTRTSIHTSIHPHIHSHIQTYTSTHPYAFMHTHPYTHTNTGIHAHTYTDTFTHTHSRMISERPGGPWRNTRPTIPAPGGGLRSLGLDVVWEIDRAALLGGPGAERCPAQQDPQAQAVAGGCSRPG